MVALCSIAVLLTILGSCYGTIGQCTFKLMAFSDSIFEANYTKEDIKLTGDDALKDCGVICSVRGDKDCHLFKYDKDQGIAISI